MTVTKQPYKFTPIIHKFVADYLSNEQKVLDIAKCHGSPVHILFPQIMEFNIDAYLDVFKRNNVKGQIYYACKVNKGNAFLEIASKHGIGVEVASSFELADALASGITGKDIVLSGPTKTDKLLLLALKHNCIISIDNVNELTNLINIRKNYCFTSKSMLLFRVNDISNLTSRFGMSISSIESILDSLFVDLKSHAIGFVFHINNYSLTDRFAAIGKLLGLIDFGRKRGYICNTINIGGGNTVKYVELQDWNRFINLKAEEREKIFFGQKCFPSFYPYHNSNDKEKFLDRILQEKLDNDNLTLSEYLTKHQVKLLIEPGRSMLDQCGITVFAVKGMKTIFPNKNIVIAEGNLNNLSEQWFNTEFMVDPILVKKEKTHSQKPTNAAVGGNTCLEMDMLSWRFVNFPNTPEVGDLLIYINTAGYQMDSNESDFHKIPIPQKIVSFKKEGKWQHILDKEFSQLD